MIKRSGGRILVDALVRNGVDLIYCVPGESYLAVLDALYDAPIRVIACRHENGASNMAEADGKRTGRPGIAFVTRGPGATNASIGVHTAMQDSTPMLLFIGDVARETSGREAFQEVDFPRMFAPLAKWATRIDDASRIPEIIARAFSLAVSGRPGPVVIALPEDMLLDVLEVADVSTAPVVQPYPDPAAMRTFEELIEAATRPLVILGGSGWDSEACASVARFAERNELPVACSFRRQSLFDNRHWLYAGDVGIGISPALAQTVRESDLLLVIGGRLGEMPTSGYSLVASPRPAQRMIHVHADPNELGRVYQADLTINASPRAFARALEGCRSASSPSRPTRWTGRARQAYEANRTLQATDAAVDLAQIVAWLSLTLDGDAIICNGAGNFAGWLHRYYQYRGVGTQVAPTSGAMGYGLPAAIAAKLRSPERQVIALSGDGDFLMTGQELATAVQYGAAVIIIVVDNATYGTIRMHQERAYPGRTIATDLVNPDFVAYARAFGAYAERIEVTDDFAPAFYRAVNLGGPALLVVQTAKEHISSRATLTSLRALSRPPS